jgi:probable blue pigment (indigoidine) exporter
MPGSRMPPVVVVLVAAAGCWGVGSVVAKRAVDEIDPLALLPIQVAVSCAVLALMRAVRRPPEPAGLRAVPWRAGLLGVLNPGLSYALSLAGLVTVSASVSVLLWALEPLFILGLAVAFTQARISRRSATMALLATTGVMAVVGQPGASADFSGILLILGGVAACGVYAVASEGLAVDAASMDVVLAQQVTALAFSLAVLAGSIGLGGWPALGAVSLTAWASAAAGGALYYGLAFWLYLAGIQRIGAVRAGMYINLVPIFGLAASAALLAERLQPRQWLGAALIVAAVAWFARAGADQPSVQPAASGSTP